MSQKKSSLLETGRQIGWMMAAGFEATRCMTSLKNDMQDYKKQALDFLAAEHPGYSAMEEDAMRHSFVSAKMSQKYGPAFIAFLGYGNEAVRDITHTNTSGDRGMDLHNNKIGRELAEADPLIDDKTLLERLWGHTKDGVLITDIADPRAVTRTYAQEEHAVAGFFENIMKLSDKIHASKAFNLF